MNNATCKHQLTTLLHLKKIENPYSQKLHKASKAGRPKNEQK